MGKRTSVYLTDDDLRRIGGQPGVPLIHLIRDGLSSREERSMAVDVEPGQAVIGGVSAPVEDLTRVVYSGARGAALTCTEHGPMTETPGGWECAGPHERAVWL